MSLRRPAVALLSLLPLIFAVSACATSRGTASARYDGSPPTGAAAEPQPNDAPGPGGPSAEAGYSQDETLDAARKFFGNTSAGLAKAIEKAFADNGRPVGYIVGEEGAGALVVGLRYGSGVLQYKNGGSVPVYWQGPSLGLDVGGDAARVFTLVYGLQWTRDLFQRFPGVDGSLYLVAGAGLNYLRAGGITLAPIRTGVGIRAGASVGYLSFTREQTVNPF